MFEDPVSFDDFVRRRRIATSFAAERDLDLSLEVLDALVRHGPRDLPELRRTIGRLVILEVELNRPIVVSDVHRVLEESTAAASAPNEFGSFLEDVGGVLAAVVESAPWRRRISEAILQWEGDGVRTTRLDAALEAHTPPDVEGLLEAFSRDATRLLEIREALGTSASDYPLDDPNELVSAEVLLATPRAGRSTSEPAPDGDEDVPVVCDSADVSVDPWFLDPERIVLSFVDIEGRLVEAPF